ncbi:hypothetical protein KCU81_g301, partial [Aureobasidium melanogenum]
MLQKKHTLPFYSTKLSCQVLSSSRLRLDAAGATGEFLALLKEAKEGTLRKPPPACLSGVIGEFMPGISCMGRVVDFGSVVRDCSMGAHDRFVDYESTRDQIFRFAFSQALLLGFERP